MTGFSIKTFFIKPSQKGVGDFEDLINSDYQIKISNWFSRGWEVFKKDAGVSIAFSVLAGICYILLSNIPLAGLLVWYPIIAGFIIVSLMSFRNQTVEFKNYFWGFRHSLPLLVFTIVSTIFIFIGLLLLIAPGIYLTVAYLFAPCLIVEKNIDFWPAMEISRKKVNKHWFEMFGFSTVIILLNIIGCLPFFIGLFITIPLSTCIITVAYKDIFMEDNQINKTTETNTSGDDTLI